MASKKIYCFLLFTLLYNIIYCQEEDTKLITKLCNFEKPLINHTESATGTFCNCESFNKPPFGQPAIKIDCVQSDIKNLNNDIFRAEVLPLATDELILSWQSFSRIPQFVGGSLKNLNMNNNQIDSISETSFMNITSIEFLDLSYNRILDIHQDSFQHLQLLHFLDLSGNRLKTLPQNIFSGLINLSILKMSFNLNLGLSFSMDISNTSQTDIYMHYGLTPKVSVLAMEYCNISHINLENGVNLEEVYLGFNNITQLRSLRFPRGVKKLDVSGNKMLVLTAKCLPHLFSLQELVMEDMPHLSFLDEYALFDLPKLKILNFQGSQNLSFIHPFVFGRNVVSNTTDMVLEKVYLRGCNLKTLNSSLAIPFDRVKDFTLDGNPFICDCGAQWIKKMDIETELRCSKPAALYGELLSDVDYDSLECDEKVFWMSKLFSSLVILVLLIVLGYGLYLIIVKMRPNNRSRKSTKVGSNSPYSPVTIQPNRAESGYY